MFSRKVARRALASSILLSTLSTHTACRTEDKAKKEPETELSAADGKKPADNSEALGRQKGYANEMTALMSQTPKALDISKYHKDAGFENFPTRIFMPKSDSNSKGAKYLTGISIAVFEQALAGKVSKDTAHYDNSVNLIKKIIETDLNFMTVPGTKGCEPESYVGECGNDNRYLASAWAIASITRGARIIDKAAPADWRAKSGWDKTKNELIAWIDNTSKAKGNPNVKPWAELIQHPGTMNWVSKTDNNGATNRTFAMLEAQMRIAELKGGQFTANRHMRDVFNDFKKYLQNYFVREENCEGDPVSKVGSNLRCLVNKDVDRNDTYHPLMGMASVGYIMDIGKRSGLTVNNEERTMILKAYHWSADWNTPRSGRFAEKDVNKGIDVWETAFRFFSPEELGPLCIRDRDKNRSVPEHKKAGLAWGYGLVAEGF